MEKWLVAAVMLRLISSEFVQVEVWALILKRQSNGKVMRAVVEVMEHCYRRKSRHVFMLCSKVSFLTNVALFVCVFRSQSLFSERLLVRFELN